MARYHLTGMDGVPVSDAQCEAAEIAALRAENRRLRRERDVVRNARDLLLAASNPATAASQRWKRRFVK